MTQPYERILFPDIENLLVGYLTTELAALGDNATVHTRVPQDRDSQSRFVLCPRVGGTGDFAKLVVDDATIGFECWAATPGEAYDLVSKLRAIVRGLPGQVLGGTPIYKVVEFAGPANLPDATSRQPRFVYTVSISFRGTAL